MKSIAAILLENNPPTNRKLLSALHRSPSVAKIVLLKKTEEKTIFNDVITINTPLPYGGRALNKALAMAYPCPFVLVIPNPQETKIFPDGIEQFLQCAENGKAGLYYADYYENEKRVSCISNVINYQTGSIRDDFCFGPLLMFSSNALQKVVKKYGHLGETNWAGLYELRLKVSTVSSISRIARPLSVFFKKVHSSQFEYVVPENLDYQREMEFVATEHLKRIGAYIAPGTSTLPEDSFSYPVEASIIIPVKNREQTIADALFSALSQKAPFTFNILVVQNHSTDKTGRIIEDLAAKDARIVNIVPRRYDLAIGGCWNEAVNSSLCGRYVCQLDSDDLYAGKTALSMMIRALQKGGYGMVVGSYSVVDYNLKSIPPYTVDHREWTEKNGQNNLLRVNGIGAPRAFPTVLLRTFAFPNVSYGEDYAVALRISREYRIGRIFKPIYLCRRWAGNTDAELSHEKKNAYDYYKDTLRTQEILARINSATGKE